MITHWLTLLSVILPSSDSKASSPFAGPRKLCVHDIFAVESRTRKAMRCLTRLRCEILLFRKRRQRAASKDLNRELTSI